MPGSVLLLSLMIAIELRQLMVLYETWRSVRFLSQQAEETGGSSGIRASAPVPQILVTVPVLDEAAGLESAVSYFSTWMAADPATSLAIVTTEREFVRKSRRNGACANPDTVQVAEELVRRYPFRHLHYPDPSGLKADQLNHVAHEIDTSGRRHFMLCYDVDSRPPQSTLGELRWAIGHWPRAQVFQQSSRFELRHGLPGRDPSRWRRWPLLALCDAGALRANRFVLGFELPRLISRADLGCGLVRKLRSAIYAHVVGHGLSVDVDLLQRLPFPTRVSLEDMYYAFYLCALNVETMPVRSLDVAEVPARVSHQIVQAARWFVGPARALKYLRDPRLTITSGTVLIAASAWLSAAEWLLCAVVPALVVGTLFAHSAASCIAAMVCLTVCAQGVVTEAALGSQDCGLRRCLRIVLLPAACTMHGLGGWLGLAALLAGRPMVGKTQRESA